MKMSMQGMVMCLFVLVTNSAQAALIDRGSGLLYDDVLHITWLQDANYAKTSGFDADGRMSWQQANDWAAGLAYGGYDDWRLPKITNFGEQGCAYAWGGLDCVPNYRISEFDYMYNVNLSLIGFYSSITNEWNQPGYGIFQDGDSHWGESTDVGLVKNLQSYIYWTPQRWLPDSSNYAWSYHMSQGSLLIAEAKSEPYLLWPGYGFYAWAVRDGDVASVPEPGTLALLGLALTGLTLTRRRNAG